jgi:hypothetical protein
MNQKLISVTVVLAVLLGVCLSARSEAANTTKIIIGAGLMAGGTALTVHGVRFCWSDCSGQTTEVIAGLAMFGVGTFLVIKGAREHHLNLNAKPELARRAILIGAGPIKHGVAGGVQVRW